MRAVAFDEAMLTRWSEGPGILSSRPSASFPMVANHRSVELMSG
jgi:hypothetical protein